jgi:hypothetical protein
MAETSCVVKIPKNSVVRASLLIIKLIDETTTDSYLSLLYYLSFALISGGGGIPLASGFPVLHTGGPRPMAETERMTGPSEARETPHFFKLP